MDTLASAISNCIYPLPLYEYLPDTLSTFWWWNYKKNLDIILFILALAFGKPLVKDHCVFRISRSVTIVWTNEACGIGPSLPLNIINGTFIVLLQLLDLHIRKQGANFICLIKRYFSLSLYLIMCQAHSRCLINVCFEWWYLSHIWGQLTDN